MANAECNSLNLFHVLGKKNFIPVLEEFSRGKFPGFNNLSRKIKITPKQLSLRLDEMEEYALIRKAGETYVITPKGKELGELVKYMKAFQSKFNFSPETCANTVCSECAQFLKK